MSVIQIFLIIHLFCIAMALGISFSNIVGFRVAKGLGGDKAEALQRIVKRLFLTVIFSLWAFLPVG